MAIAAPAARGPDASPALAPAENDEEKDDDPGLREAYFHDQRAAPLNEIPPGALLRARQQLAERVASGTIRASAQRTGSVPVSPGTVSEGAWTSIGPQPVGSGASGSGVGPLPNSGRVTAVAVVDSNTAYIGAATGGVWKTTDGGSNWTPLTDNVAGLATGSVGAIALDPNNSGIVYVGLGEQNFSGDSYYGFGILKSINGGSTWTLNNPSGIFDRLRVGRIAVDPRNSQTIYAATDGGIAKSPDGGASWAMASLGTCCIVSDVVIDSGTNPSTVYAARGNPSGATTNGVWRTTTDLANVTASWINLPGTGSNLLPKFLSGLGTGRIRLAITRGTSPVTLYAVVHRVEDGALTGLWKTTDGGSNWTQTTHPESILSPTSLSICADQCWYDLDVAVYPTDSNLVYVLTKEVFASGNGGASWSLISNGYTGPPYKTHVDQHAFDFIPGSPGGFYFGNDGGVYRSLDGGASITNLNQTLNITQFYRGSAHPTSATSIFGGTQDNGSLSYENSLSWYRSVGRDGGYNAIDFNNASNVYASTQNLGIRKSTGGSRGTFLSASTGIPDSSSETRQFIAPLAMDPTNPQVLYAGTTRLYRTSDAAGSWSAISPVLASYTSSSRNAISAIGVSPNSSVIYAGTGSSSLGNSRLWVTTDGGSNWADRSSGLPNRTITSIGVHPTDSQTAYATVSGFSAGHIWKTTTSGATWTNVSGSLPDTPVNAIAVDPADGQLLYIATDVGVFKSTDSGNSWAALNTGLPQTVINDLVLNRTGTRLFAFTHGRGVYASDRSSAPASSTGLLRVYSDPSVATTIKVDGVSRNDWGLDWLELPAGDYTLSFGEVTGFLTPTTLSVKRCNPNCGSVTDQSVSSPVTVRSGETTEVRGPFSALGFLRATTEGSGTDSPTVSIDSNPANEWGVWVAMPSGQAHTISFEDLPGRTRPCSRSISATAGATTHLHGSYTSGSCNLMEGASLAASVGAPPANIGAPPSTFAPIGAMVTPTISPGRALLTSTPPKTATPGTSVPSTPAPASAAPTMQPTGTIATAATSPPVIGPTEARDPRVQSAISGTSAPQSVLDAEATRDAAARVARDVARKLASGVGSPPARIAATWTIQVVDSLGDVGGYASLALDASGNPRVSYMDSTNSDLKYAQQVGGSWTTQRVDISGGYVTSLALDAVGWPHISYESAGIKYASWNGSAWTIQTVDSGGGWNTSLKLDVSGNPHISYSDFSNRLKYARRTGNGWAVETVDPSGPFVEGTSLAIDSSGNIHISYYDAVNKDLKYARRSGGTWTIQTVDSGGGVGSDSSLALDGSGNPHISYWDGTNVDLKHARWTGSAWTTEVVDPLGGFETSIAIDSAGNPRIAYEGLGLHYARWTGSTWTVEVVDGSVWAFAVSLALDSSENPRIAYYDFLLGDLKYASAQPSTPLPTATATPTATPKSTATPTPTPGGTGLLRLYTDPAAATTIKIDGVPRNDWGLDWLKLPAGSYTLAFSGVTGFFTPSTISVKRCNPSCGSSTDQSISTAITVRAGETTEVRAPFTAVGFLRVTTEGATSPTVSIDGYPTNEWGAWVALAAGSHTASFETISGTSHPCDRTVILSAGATIHVHGSYATGSCDVV